MFLLITWLCSALPLLAQLERGTVLLSPGLSYNRAKTQEFVTLSTIVVDTSEVQSRHAGVVLQVGRMGKKHREWGVSALYEWRETAYPKVHNPIPLRIDTERKLAGNLYYRKYYPLKSRLWTGYQMQFMMAMYNTDSEFVGVPQSGTYATGGYLRVMLDANVFVGGFITRRLGARLSFGSARIGYLLIQEGVLAGGPFAGQDDRLEANLGWNPAGATRFSLVWAFRPRKQ